MERSNQQKPAWEIRGVGASPGIAIGKAFVKLNFRGTGNKQVIQSASDVQHEIEKFDKAVQRAVDDVEAIKVRTDLALSGEALQILETHLELITDVQIRIDVMGQITNHKKNAVDALSAVIQLAVQTLKNVDDEYLRARADDVQDIGDRISRHLGSSASHRDEVVPKNSILIADDVSPSDMITIDVTKVIAFASVLGSKTSHAAILAKSKKIPAVLGCGEALHQIENLDTVIIDGLNGLLIINPSAAELEKYVTLREFHIRNLNLLSSLKDVAAKTTDGVRIKLLANTAWPDDIASSFEYGAEGSGLFRTEMLFLNSNTFPTEDEQYEFYKQVALRSKGHPVTIRTMDIGGDKPLSYLDIPKEDNPFLGYRGIRISIDRKDIFITQLKAILRASTFGNFRIMFPMIGDIEQLRIVKSVLEEARRVLRENKIEFCQNIPVGMMIEVPAAALIADVFAREVDFFSIGTNDLCQYAVAVDRGNERIKDLYDPFHPGVLRLINYVIEQAYLHHIEVGMCGELAADPRATALLLGMGLREFSMTPSSIPAVKRIILDCSSTAAKGVWDKVRTMNSSTIIMKYLQAFE